MNSRLVVLLLVGTLVVTAGCVGGSDTPESNVSADADGDDADGSTNDPADGTSIAGDDADGPTGDPADRPPTVSDDADEPAPDDSLSLVEDRTAALQQAGSYTSNWQTTVTEDGTVVGEISYTTAVDYETERSHFTMAQANEGELRDDYEVYHADGTSYSRYGTDETYFVNDDATFSSEASLFAPTMYVRTSDDLDGYAKIGTETFDGTTVTRYELTERPAWFAGQAPDTEASWTEFSYTVLVDDEGLVRSEGWRGEGIGDDGTAHVVEYSYSLTGVGSTVVEAPDWIDAARVQS